jgi:UDPglucose--hexose-1-phosphate uridylyltransferase
MDLDRVAQVVDAWAESYARLGRRPDVAYVLIFENRGAIMGNSQLHPHGQVYAYGSIPDLMLEGQLRSFERSDFVAEAAAFECEDGRRIVGRTAAWIAFVPFAAAFPYDVTVVPLSPVASLLETGTEERRELAGLLKDVLTGLDRLFGAPYPYSLALIQAPTDGKERRFHMQLHLTSLLRGPGLRKHVVGADIYGRTVNPSDPNLTAAEIRRAIALRGRRGG